MAVSLPIWSPRVPRMQQLETVGNVAQFRSQWDSCIGSFSSFLWILNLLFRNRSLLFLIFLF